eukprot:6221773-Karenia_brevis.AAC.1
MKLTLVWFAIPIFTEIATDMSQPRRWARHVGTDVASCWSPRDTDLGDGSGHLGNPKLCAKMSVPMSYMSVPGSHHHLG